MSISITRTILSQNGSQIGVSPHGFRMRCSLSESTIYGTSLNLNFRNMLCRTIWNDPNASGTGTCQHAADPTRTKDVTWGLIASHVYRETEGSGSHSRTPATYLSDGASVASDSSITLTVQDPATVFSGTNTIATSATSTAPTPGVNGCPTGADCRANIDTVSELMALTGAGLRVLATKGQTLTGPGSGFRNIGGPCQVGSFGSGANTLIQATANGIVFLRSGNSGGPRNDLTFYDLDFDGNGHTDIDIFNYLGDDGGNFHENRRHDGVLFLNITGTGLARGIWTMQQSYMFYHDCDLTTKTGNDTANVLYGEWVHSTMFNCRITQTEILNLGNGAIRNGHPMGLVLSNSTIIGAQSGRQHVKLHNALTASPIAREMVLSCCKYMQYGTTFSLALNEGGPGPGQGDIWWIDIGPDNGTDHQELETWVFEDNWCVASPNCFQMLYTYTGYYTVRNNFFDFNQGSEFENRPVTVKFQGPGSQPAVTDVEVYLNTGYTMKTNTSSDPNQGFQFVAVDNGVGTTNVRVRGNLAWAGNYTVRGMLYDPGNVVGANQSDNTFVATPSNTWVGTNGSGGGFPNSSPVPGHFLLRSSAPERGDATVDVPVFKDFFNKFRPQGTPGENMDTGAFEFDEGTSMPWDVQALAQEGFRFRNDDGSESSATWKAAQDTNILLALDQPLRLRATINTGGDQGTKRYRLEYKKPADSTWLVVKSGEGAVRMNASANITAGGEVTTAQLTAPAGKTTANFSDGRMWDDENGADYITIVADEYTELEWSIILTSPAVQNERYQFRVTKST